MSQFGAFGYASTAGRRRHPRPLLHRHGTWPTAPAHKVRCSWSPTPPAARSAARARRPRKLDTAVTYTVRRARAHPGRPVDDDGQRVAPFRRRCRSPARAGSSRSAARGLPRRARGPPRPLGGLRVVNALGLEDYVHGVVSAESPRLAGRGAAGPGDRRAHLRDHDGQAAPDFDQYADTRSQVYGGVGGETPATNAAVAATRGAGRHLPGPAGRHVLLLDHRRQDRERREHAARRPAAGLAEVGRRPVRRRLAAPPLGADSCDGAAPRKLGSPRQGPFRASG